MFGFIVGIVCLIGLIKVVRRGRHHHHFGGHHGCHGPRHHRGWGRHHRGGPRRGPGGPFGRRALHRLFERLDTTPDQERVIREAFDEVFAEGGKMREHARGLGDATRETMAAELFTEDVLEQAFADQDAAIARFRESVKHGLKEIHEVLDERQRQELSSMMRRFGFGPFTPREPAPEHDGPYR